MLIVLLLNFSLSLINRKKCIDTIFDGLKGECHLWYICILFNLTD